jgi:Peptidase family S41
MLLSQSLPKEALAAFEATLAKEPNRFNAVAGAANCKTIIPLGSGTGALRLTTARYFTPSGRSIQAKGISPDIEVLQEVPEERSRRASTRAVRLRCADTSRPKATRRPARSPTSRRIRRMTRRCTLRSISSAASRRTRPTRRTPRRRSRTRSRYRKDLIKFVAPARRKIAPPR